MAFTMKDWIALVVSSLIAYIVFGNISSKAGYPRWLLSDAYSYPEHRGDRDFRVFSVAS